MTGYTAIVGDSQNRYSGFMKSIHFSKTEVRHYILYRVANRRRKYICRLTIGCMLKKKSRHGSVFMFTKDHDAM